MMRRWGTLFLALMIARVFPGCDDGPKSLYKTGYDGPKNACSRPSDCKGRTVCDQKYAMCARTDPLDGRRFFAEYFPPNGTSRIFEVRFSKTGEAFVSLPEAVPVRFRVRVTANEESPLTVNAYLYILDTQVLPGRPPRIITTEVAQGPTIPTVRLWPGTRRYQIHIIPKDISPSAPPPKYYDDISVRADEAGGVLKNAKDEVIEQLTLENADFEVHGEILTGNQPLFGLNVQLIDTETHRLVSTPDITGCVDPESDEICGFFDLGVRNSDIGDPSTGAAYELRIQKKDEVTYPVTRIEHFPEDLGETRLPFRLPPLPTPVRLDASVQGKVLLQGGVIHDAIPGCRIVFEADEEGDGIEVRNQIYADSDHAGIIHGLTDQRYLYLYPATYEVYIIPPSLSPTASVQYGVWRDLWQVDGAASVFSDRSFELPFRQHLFARVEYAGKSVPNARLTATPLQSEPDSPYTPEAFSAPLADGRLSLWADTGRYRITVAVPPSSGLAYRIFDYEVVKPADENALEAPIEIEMASITPPLPIVGRLYIFIDGAAASGGRLDWYEVIDAQAVPIGRSDVNAYGVAIGLIPPAD